MLRLFFFWLDFTYRWELRSENNRPFTYTLNAAMATRFRSRTKLRKEKSVPPIQLLPLSGLREIKEGDDLSAMLVAAARKSQLAFEAGDILVIAQKAVSKSEGRAVNLSSIQPSVPAATLAAKRNRDARLIEVVLRESRRIVRDDPVIITETHHGYVCANSGVDHSNVPGTEMVTLLPVDPDQSAARLAQALRKRTGAHIPVVITDTFGRPWRLGLVNVAIGAAGLSVLLDLRGARDCNGKRLQATIVAVADELAAAAGLCMGKAAGIPAVIIRGYKYKRAQDSARRIIRPANEDLFR